MQTYSAHTYQFPFSPWLEHWTDIKISALWSRVGWTPACSNERTNECHRLLMVVGQLLITPTVEICIQQLGRVEEMV